MINRSTFISYISAVVAVVIKSIRMRFGGK